MSRTGDPDHESANPSAALLPVHGAAGDVPERIATTAGATPAAGIHAREAPPRAPQVDRYTGDGAAVTSLLRQEADGSWVPNFPGAEKLEMTRRPD